MDNKQILSVGFTLLELVVCVCILGILTSVAIPSFMNVINENRITSTANQLVTALSYAKSEAIKRGIQITIKHKDTTACVWDQGWDIFADNNRNGNIDSSDELLKSFGALPDGYTLRTGGNYASWVAFDTTGVSRGATGFANDTFRLCNSSGDKDKSRSIIIKMGRIRTEIGKTKCP